MPLAFVYLAERFGGFPWEIEEAPLDRVMFYLRVVGVEGRVKAELDGLARDEEFVRHRLDQEPE